MGWVKISINVTEYPSLHEIFKSYLIVNAKIIKISVAVVNEHRENTSDTYILKVRVRGHT